MKVRTGVSGLDKMLNGGIIEGRNILVPGPCGSGKTTLAMHFVYNGATKFNEPGLFMSLEEKPDKVCADMANFGMDVKKAVDDGNLHLIGGPLAGLKSFMMKVDSDIDDVLWEIKDVIKENKIKRVAIDSINLFTMLVRDEETKRKSLASLCNSLSATGCTSFLTSETNEGTLQLSRHGIEEFVADGVIALYMARQGARFVPGIAVRKMRGSSHDKEIRYYEITDKGITVYPDETMFAEIK
ncbi:MAG: hypothetical protein NTY90_00700 [Candidatus Micrarchaeota archaeon]|nr:hypothetical protein [Candidatus Micrarchaeota archaeon]